MAMPAETPAPCRVKQASAMAARGGAPAFASGFSTALVLVGSFTLAGSFAFAELVRVGALGLDHDGGALAGGQHHHAHDALGVHAPAVARQPDLARELARGLGELGRGPRVQAQLVDDLSFRLGHCNNPSS